MAYSIKDFKAAGRRGGIASSSRKYLSLVTGHVSTRSGISKIHARLGVDSRLVIELPVATTDVLT